MDFVLVIGLKGKGFQFMFYERKSGTWYLYATKNRCEKSCYDTFSDISCFTFLSCCPTSPWQSRGSTCDLPAPIPHPCLDWEGCASVKVLMGSFYHRLSPWCVVQVGTYPGRVGSVSSVLYQYNTILCTCVLFRDPTNNYKCANVFGLFDYVGTVPTYE